MDKERKKQLILAAKREVESFKFKTYQQAYQKIQAQKDRRINLECGLDLAWANSMRRFVIVGSMGEILDLLCPIGGCQGKVAGSGRICQCYKLVDDDANSLPKPKEVEVVVKSAALKFNIPFAKTSEFRKKLRDKLIRKGAFVDKLGVLSVNRTSNCLRFTTETRILMICCKPDCFKFAKRVSLATYACDVSHKTVIEKQPFAHSRRIVFYALAKLVEIVRKDLSAEDEGLLLEWDRMLRCFWGRGETGITIRKGGLTVTIFMESNGALFYGINNRTKNRMCIYPYCLGTLPSTQIYCSFHQKAGKNERIFEKAKAALPRNSLSSHADWMSVVRKSEDVFKRN